MVGGQRHRQGSSRIDRDRHRVGPRRRDRDRSGRNNRNQRHPRRLRIRVRNGRGERRRTRWPHPRLLHWYRGGVKGSPFQPIAPGLKAGAERSQLRNQQLTATLKQHIQRLLLIPPTRERTCQRNQFYPYRTGCHALPRVVTPSDRIGELALRTLFDYSVRFPDFYLGQVPGSPNVPLFRVVDAPRLCRGDRRDGWRGRRRVRPPWERGRACNPTDQARQTREPTASGGSRDRRWRRGRAPHTRSPAGPSPRVAAPPAPRSSRRPWPLPATAARSRQHLSVPHEVTVRGRSGYRKRSLPGFLTAVSKD